MIAQYLPWIGLIAGVLLLVHACRVLAADARGGVSVTMGGEMWFGQLWTPGTAACAWSVAVLTDWSWWSGVLLFVALFFLKSVVYRMIAAWFVGRDLPVAKPGGFSAFVKRSEKLGNEDRPPD